MLSDIKLFKPGFFAMGSTEADTSNWEMPQEMRLTPLTSATSVAATPSTFLWDEEALAQKQQQLEHEQKAQELQLMEDKLQLQLQQIGRAHV